MKKNIIISGTSRSGKTTLAIKISKKFNYSVVGLDPIVSAFEQSFPQLGITHSNRDGTSVKNLEPFLFNYMAINGSSNKAKRGLNFIYEGSYFDWEKLIQERIRKKYIVIFLGCNYSTEDEYFHKIRQNDKEVDWTSKLSDEELKDYCRILKDSNRRLFKVSQKYDITYFDTSNDREQILDEIILFLEDAIEEN